METSLGTFLALRMVDQDDIKLMYSTAQRSLGGGDLGFQ